MEEKVMKKEGDGEHPKSHYLVATSDNVTDWHLRVRGMDGKPDHTLMGAAWAALHGGYRGNKYEGPNKAEALKKLTALYRSEGMPLPGQSKAIFFKDKATTWFLGIYSNNFEDREEEILSNKAHEEYVAWVKDKGIKPPIIVLHQPKYADVVHLAHLLALETGRITPEKYNANYMKLYEKTAIAQTEAVALFNGFVLVIGKVLPDKLELVNKLQKVSSEWGMSHGFNVLRKNVNIIDSYRSFEFTVAPIGLAANSLTAIGFKDIEMGEEVEKLPEEVAEVLDAAKAEEVTKTAQQLLQDLVNSKTVENPEVQYDTLREKLTADFKLAELSQTLTAIAEKVTSQDETIAQLKTLVTSQAEVIEKLSAVLVNVQKSEDEKVAEKISIQWPKFATSVAGSLPTQDEKEKIEAIKEKLPEKIVEKTTAAGKENPLNLGLYSLFS